MKLIVLMLVICWHPANSQKCDMVTLNPGFGCTPEYEYLHFRK